MQDDQNRLNPSPRQESILVCVSYGPNSERLIRRGWELANAFQASLTILTVDAQDDNQYSEARETNMSLWESLSKKIQAEFLVAKNRSRNVAKTIAEAAKEKQVTQIVIGQSARSRWEEIAGDSIINGILREIEHVDIHVVAVQREIPLQQEDYEPGVQAYLVKDGEQDILQFDPPAKDAVQGLFFQSIYTDFNNGVFKVTEPGKVTKYQIFDGTVTRKLSETFSP
ncbi:universal stress protein [Paenibacillus lemnae]|uniref:Universal stress protein n=1 Tax=Paenibacillus lemnae TaxID=1330551 RepID=A0A848M330_PAELE|nr:universal stress protein [Paenibacillus lemnae]NMO95418.1 universal stress protein [Paenibacillus lemnae]